MEKEKNSKILNELWGFLWGGCSITTNPGRFNESITNAVAFHFVDGVNVANEYAYDANGNITKDLKKRLPP